MAHEMFVHAVHDRAGPRLAPYGPADLELMGEVARLRAPGGFRCVLTTPRSDNRNRWYHAMLTHVAAKHGEPMAALKLWVKMRLGLADRYWFDGQLVPVLRSMSYAQMDEAEFKDICDRTIQLFLEEGLVESEKELRADVDREVRLGGKK